MNRPPQSAPQSTTQPKRFLFSGGGKCCKRVCGQQQRVGERNVNKDARLRHNCISQRRLPCLQISRLRPHFTPWSRKWEPRRIERFYNSKFKRHARRTEITILKRKNKRQAGSAITMYIARNISNLAPATLVVTLARSPWARRRHSVGQGAFRG